MSNEQEYTYGIVWGGDHIDVSKSEKGAKRIATQKQVKTITRRKNDSYIAHEYAYKPKGSKWIRLNNGQARYLAKH